MRTITITCAEARYPLHIGCDARQTLPQLIGKRRVILITDETVGAAWAATLFPTQPPTITIPSGEVHKTVATLGTIWSGLRSHGADRKSVVVNLGGGVVSDIGGFAASTYMRGIPFVNIPTTLLAQVDASVGGKTGIDHDGVKNLCGTFCQPEAVIIDPTFLTTLPAREFYAGCAEMIKHGIIADGEALPLFEQGDPRMLPLPELETLIARSCEVKAKIVQEDPLEGGARKLLNFGHTAGHAIEALSLHTSAPLLHGEAIALGMVIEATLAVRLSLLKSAEYERIARILSHAHLPIRFDPPLSLQKLLTLMRSDKKSVQGTLKWVLPTALGAARYDVEAPEAEVIAALGSALRIV